MINTNHIESSPPGTSAGFRICLICEKTSTIYDLGQNENGLICCCDGPVNWVERVAGCMTVDDGEYQ